MKLGERENNKLLNLHEGHRNRLRNSLVENEWENIEEHKMLEYILGISIPRKDTNEIAHALIEEFGSLANVLDASIEDLKMVKGVGEVTAVFLHSIPNIFKAYKKSKVAKRPDLSNTNNVIKFIGEIFNHMPMEELYLVAVNASSKLITYKKMARGTNNEVAFTLKSITETAVRTQAQGIILIHNHPNGDCAPSKEDIQMTRQIYYNLSLSNIYLLDHIIITKYDGMFYSFYQSGIIANFEEDYKKLISGNSNIHNNKPKYE